MPLSNQQIAAMYDAAKRVYDSQTIRARALEQLRDQHAISDAVGSDTISNFRHMRLGERYRRTMTGATTAYLLNSIRTDYGPEGLRLALDALKAHYEYLEGHRNSTCVQERRLYQEHLAQSLAETTHDYPDELQSNQAEFIEGATKQVLVNRYERDPRARSACIDHWGCGCYVCGFNFGQVYGAKGDGFIHVHHLVDIATIGEEYAVNPVRDLRPVCPNCHAMLHTQRPALDVDVLKALINTATTS